MPLNPHAKLISNPFDLAALERKPTRDGLWGINAVDIQLYNYIMIVVCP